MKWFDALDDWVILKSEETSSFELVLTVHEAASAHLVVLQKNMQGT